MLAGILACSGGNFGGQKPQNQAVFIGGPHGAVLFQKTGSGAFLPAETTGTVVETGRKPFKTDRNLPQLAVETVDHAIDEATADQGFTDHCRDRPLRTVSQE